MCCFKVKLEQVYMLQQLYGPWQQPIFAPQLPRITHWEGFMSSMGPHQVMNPIALNLTVDLDGQCLQKTQLSPGKTQNDHSALWAKAW